MNLLYVLILFAGVICFFASSWARRTHNIDLVAVGLGLVFLVPFLQYTQRL